MFETLSDMGRADLVYAMLNQTDYPGYGYMVGNGATTVSSSSYLHLCYHWRYKLWESWFWSNSTYSHNHAMFGSVSSWFYEYLAGLSSKNGLAFELIQIYPRAIVSGLDWAAAVYESVRGTVASEWQVFQNSVSFEKKNRPTPPPPQISNIKYHFFRFLTYL